MEATEIIKASDFNALEPISKPPSARLARIGLQLRSWLDVVRRSLFPAPVSVLETVTAHWMSQAVIVAVELQVAEALEDGPRNIKDLATRVGAHPDALYRVLRALAGIGIFKELPGQAFALNRLARPLLRNSPNTVYGMCLMNGRAFHWNAWGGLIDSVRTGRSAVELQTGQGLFSYLQTNPSDGRAFDLAMQGWATQAGQAAVEAVDFSKYKTIVDVGGGTGRFLSLVLARFQTSRGILFDQPQVIQNARDVLRAAEVSSRCEIIGGSFFETVPSGGDAYILKNIIHDWDDTQARAILTNIRQAMSPKSRLFIVESVVPESAGFHPGKLIDLEMLVCTPGGKERTRSEFRTLFAESGLELVTVHLTGAIESVVEARASNV